MSVAGDNIQPRRRNWWRIAFFVLLFVLELSREVFVIYQSGVGNPYVSEYFNVLYFENDVIVTARGAWKRIDKENDRANNSIFIECRKNLGICIEATVSFFGRGVAGPRIEIFNSKFSKEGVAYEQEYMCATSYTKIDYSLKKVYSVKVRNKNRPESCDDGVLSSKTEERLSFELVGSEFSDLNTIKGDSFLPIIKAILLIFDIF